MTTKTLGEKLLLNPLLKDCEVIIKHKGNRKAYKIAYLHTSYELSLEGIVIIFIEARKQKTKEFNFEEYLDNED